MNYDEDTQDVIIVEKDNDESENMPTVNIKDYKFTTMGGDIQIRQLVQQISEGDIEIPNIQRKYVWSNSIASRFIESALLDLPLPSIFLCRQTNGKYLIIDGLQRLTTLKQFLNMESVNGKTFKISNSKDIYKDWRGKTFGELTLDDQRRLKNKTIHAIIVEQLHPENYDGLFLIFERINSGGVQLNQQEIRNAIFQNKYTAMLSDINENSLWREVFGDNSPHKRMKDIEMILRFLALKEHKLKSIDTGSVSFVELLNKHMSNNINITNENMEVIKNEFFNTLSFVTKTFGKNVFRTNPSDNNNITKKFFATIFDAIMISTYYSRKQDSTVTSSVKNLYKLFSNEEFRNYINSHTTENKAIFGRISLACEILYGIKYANWIHWENKQNISRIA